MIKKSLLLTLLLAFMAPWAANAYNHQVQVGDGTSGQNIAPINLYYNYSYSQQIYTADQINAECVYVGDIESISFYYAGSVAKTVPITVFMKTTEKTSFATTSDWETVTEDDIVFNGDLEIPSTAGWVTITLNAPFAYDGESNLLIAIDKGYYDNYTNQNWRYTAVTNNQVIQYRSDGTDPNPYSPTTASGISKNLSNILFNMTIAHPAPSALTVDEVVINTATISWTAPQTTNTITGYAYEYTDSNDVFTGTTTGTTANLTGLTAATDYLFEVKAIYSDGESCWSEALEFTTMEACMTPENLTISDVTAHAATLNWTEGYGDGQWVLRYKLSTDEEYTNSVEVALADLPYTLTGLTAESTYNVLIAPVCDDTKTITDNFTTTVACFAPTNLAVEANVQTATFTWESDVNDYEIAHATVATADPNDNIVGTATENTYSMSNLTIDTDHYFWVRSNCGSEGYSSWAGPASVHIGYCVPNPSSHDGKGITGVSFGTGDYVVTNGDGSASLPASAPYYGNYSSMIGAVQAGVESTIAITTGTNSYPYTFVIWVDFDNSLSFEDSEVVYIGKASSGNGTLNATITIPATQELGDYRMRIYGADSYFTSFYNNGNPDYTKPHDPCSSGSYRHAHDYTLRVLEAPSCLTPTGLTVSDVTAHEATISWTSDAAAWLVMLNDNMEDLAYVEEATYTFTNLTPETTYTVKVQADCDGTYSDWTNAISFTTLVACPAPTGLEVTYEGGATATLAWTENGTATEWDVEFDTDPEFDYYTTVNVSGTPSTELAGLALATTYYVRVKTYCGTEGYSTYSNTVNFTTDLCLADDMCELTFTLTDAWGDGWNGNAIVVTDVLTGEVLATMANENLNGTSGSGENEVNIKTLAVCDGREIQFSWTSGSYVNETSYIVTDINGEVILEGSGRGFETFTYTVDCTLDPCMTPKDLAVDEIGVSYAFLSWTGNNEAYNLQYRHPVADPTATTATVILTAGNVWGDGSGYQMLLDADATAYGTIIPEIGSSYGYISTDGTIGGTPGDVSSSVYDEFEYKVPENADGSLSTENIVVNNSISIEIPAGTYDWCITNPTSGDRMWIAASNGNVGGRYNDFVFEAGLTYEFTISNYGPNDGVDVAITPLSDWILVENVTTPYDFIGLNPLTMYEWQVQGISTECEGGVTDWSATNTFITLNGQIFTRDIAGYGTGNGNWYLIATPIGNIKPANVTDMIADPADDYDLYAWDGTTTEVDVNNDTLVWRNFKTGEFTQLEPGKGYLYANKNTVTLSFIGTPYDGDGTFDLTYDEANETACLNLVGNPYAVTATIDGDRSFYVLNSDGDKFLASTSNTIEAMEGIFVVAESEGDQVTFTPETGDKSANLALNLSQGLSIIDRAIVRFDEGGQLPKYQLNPNDTKVYIPQEGKDYAVVSGSEMGEMPVNFKAESNGSYTLSFSSQEVSFNYLHLIDNMTGADVDLLVNPSYSFDANTTDYASRFKLVFATGNNSDDNFAFYSNGSFVISNEGNAVLQVVDVTGRILNNETINGSANVHVDAAPGVYMLRLINGDNVKVQKVVVR